MNFKERGLRVPFFVADRIEFERPNESRLSNYQVK